MDFSKEEFDIVIQAGQSNSQGCGLGDVEAPFIPNGNIWYFTDSHTVTMAQEDVVDHQSIGNFSLTFADEYVKSGRLRDGRKLLIIRAAVGGTGFADNRWGMKDDLFLGMMDMTKRALALNPENNLVALLWHQGETDAQLNVSYKVHFKNLKTLVNAVKNTFNYKNLPFIAADFVGQWKKDNLKICEPVIQAIKDVCARIGNAKFVETSELQSNDQKVGNGDTIHFCRDAQYQLGEKYFSAFEQIMKSRT